MRALTRPAERNTAMDGCDRTLNDGQVAAALGVSTDTLKQMVKDGQFPESVYVTARTRGWLPKDVESFLYLRSRMGRPPAKLEWSQGKKSSEHPPGEGGVEGE
jgi:predicted DNA-binding transcriptional regulator AlpA